MLLPLQRTAPAVTLAASGHRLAPTVQPARQPPQSLSLGSLDVMTPWARIPMQLIQIEAEQSRGYAHEKWYDGATINCYIKDQSAENALYIAKGWIAKNGWDVLEVEEQREITEGDFAETKEGREYFQQALIDEEVFVYYTFDRREDSSEPAADATRNI